MTPIEREIRARIASDGPMPLSQYMALALGHPTQGYYATRDPLGKAGDFVTAPEITQVFGELIGLWCAVIWQMMGEPDSVNLVELGPGRGTLAADLLRAARTKPRFAAAIRLHLVEISPALRAQQKARLAEAAPVWHTSLARVPEGPAIIVANEFFDALPIDQYEKGPDGWRRRCVAIDRSSDALVMAPEACATVDAALPADAPSGTVREISVDGRALVSAIGARLAHSRGAALVIDYGPIRSAPGDSFQAVRGHRFHDPLLEPGAADLTAHVDFTALADAARAAGAATYGPVTQAEFLRRLGIEERTELLCARAAAASAQALRSGCRRLIAANEMGNLFKALALVHRALPAPPGFANGGAC